MNNIISTALLKEQLKRFWGSSALLFICYALTIALPIYNRTGRTQLNLLALLINMENEFMIFSVLFAPLIAVIVLFKYQNQVKSATAMHSYPITRNQLLATNALAAMILLVLPLLVFCIIMVSPMHQAYIYIFNSSSDTFIPRLPRNHQLGALANSLLFISRFFIITVLSFLFHLLLYMMAATLSGNSIITLLLCAALPLLPIGLYWLVVAICEFYIFGFYSMINLDNHLIYIHPILWGDRDGPILLQVVSYSVIIIAMAACSVFTANKRAQERAGDSVVFPYIKNALVFILSVCGLLLMGFIFYGMYESTTAMYVGFAIGFFIAYCIAQMIAEKTFNILNKMKDFIKFGAIAVGLLLLIIVSTWSDIFGYERYIPRLEDIEGIQIQDTRFLFDNRDALTNTILNELLVKDPEIINETIAFHQAILNEGEALRRYDLERVRNSRYATRDFSILYKLRNGNVIVRHYHLPTSFRDENDLSGLLARNQLSISLFQNRPDLIDSIDLTLNRYHARLSDTHIVSPDHILELVNVLVKDHEYVIQGITPTSEFLQVRIFLADEFVSWRRRINSFQFNIEYNDHIRDWLFENGYLN